jgi:hypothetical protein
MNATSPRSRLNWSARLLIALTLIIVGAAAATWALARYDRAAQFLGVLPSTPQSAQSPRLTAIAPSQAQQQAAAGPAVPADAARIAELETRLARVENATQQAQGSAGRADALVIAFAARRAIDRGVPLGYLETLLVDRFGPQYPQAVATIVTASREPVRLNQLIAEYEELAPELRSGGSEEGWLQGFQRELASLVEIRRAAEPSARPDARYQRAAARLSAGEVDAALAETMRLPGARNAGPWIAKARRYVAAHRALDQIESSALLAGSAGGR